MYFLYKEQHKFTEKEKEKIIFIHKQLKEKKMFFYLTVVCVCVHIVCLKLTSQFANGVKISCSGDNFCVFSTPFQHRKRARVFMCLPYLVLN